MVSEVGWGSVKFVSEVGWGNVEWCQKWDTVVSNGVRSEMG